MIYRGYKAGVYGLKERKIYFNEGNLYSKNISTSKWSLYKPVGGKDLHAFLATGFVNYDLIPLFSQEGVPIAISENGLDDPRGI